MAVVENSLNRSDLSRGSVERFIELMRRFASFVSKQSTTDAADAVTGATVGEFVRARTRDGSEPAVATMHLRRAAVRLLFSEGRRLGLVVHDPTLDMSLPPRTKTSTRPLTDDEIALCRSHALTTLSATRVPAAWGLAEATARTAEIAHVRIADVDLEHGRVWIHGSPKTEARWGELASWGRLHVERRVHALGAHPTDSSLICPIAANPASARTSAGLVITDTLRRAGIHLEADVRPSSVAAWTGATAFAGGMPLHEVALLLGVRSLDRAAAFIRLDWRSSR